MIGIIDYGMGNLGSVTNAFGFLGVPARLVAKPAELAACEALVLPGVGAFGDCLRHLQQHGFVEPVKTWIHEDRPFLGLCLGLQALFEGSDEAPGVPGLGILPGWVRRFPAHFSLKIPQIGWNRVMQKQQDCPLFAGVPDGGFFYFVHSYYVDPARKDVVAGETEYGLRYASAVRRGRLMAVQFHPEKSQALGLLMLRNFAGLLSGARP